MGTAVVLAVLLKVELIGYDGPAPLLPAAPINEEEGRGGLRRFTYDVSPSEVCLMVEDACARMGSKLERVLTAPDPPFPEGVFARRLTLEFGLLADRADTSFSYAWPPDFLRVLVDCDVQLNVSHYLPAADAGEDE